MSEKIYVNILKWGVFASMLSMFLVFKNLLFPYISSKQISFNLIIEILLIFWVALIVKYPQYRPKKSYISFGLLAYFFILVISCFTGADFNLSFWGDVERMLGVFHLLHFLALYFIIVTVFRTREDWRLLLNYIVILASFVSLYAIANNKSDSTFGNPTYTASFFMFSFYFSLLLFFGEKNKYLRWVYGIPLFLSLWSFKESDISGAFVGLGSSFIAMLFLYTLLSSHKKLKIVLAVLFITATIGSVVVLLNQDSAFVRGSALLRPFSEINFNNPTLNTRLISWRAALQDFPNHPLLGSGYGNYSLTFDKYFDPKFYNYTRSETYFDKAHNNIVEIIATTGILGLITYLSIFAAIAYYLIFGYRQKKIGVHEFVLVGCLLTAYFIQLLAAFDALVTYLVSMTTFAYVYYLYNRGSEEDEKKIKKNMDETMVFGSTEIYALVIVGVTMLLIAYQYNVKVYNMLAGTIDGQKAYAEGKVMETIDIYKKTLASGTVLDRDSRSSLINLFAANPAVINSLPVDKREGVINFLVSLVEANVKYNEHDSMMQMMLAQVYNLAAMYYIPSGDQSGDVQKFYEYSDKALKAIDASIEASPRRVPIYFQKAQILLTRGEKEKTIETLQYAASLNPDYPDGFFYLGRAYLLLGQEQEAYDNIGKCIDSPTGGQVINYPDLTRQYLAYYENIKDWPRVIRLYEFLTEQEKDNADNWAQLANFYKEQGDINKARIAAEKAMEIDISLTSSAQDFINSLDR
ncbi:MAG TPA: O-antigen ligase family protein [bacterium]|nr:O-antigen ligase family protein [bacterium]